MSYMMKLPDQKEQRESAMVACIEDAKSKRCTVAARWWLNYFYLQGARNFTEINYNTGTVNVSYINQSGQLQYRYDGVVKHFRAELGRLLNVDLSPAVESAGGVSLDGMRKSAIARATLEFAFPPKSELELKAACLPDLLLYGTIGINTWDTGSNQMGIEVVPPWEILPIPPDATRSSDCRGLVRRRYVPIEWVKGLKIAPSSKSKIWDEIEKTKLPVGSIPSESDARFQSSGTGTTQGPAQIVSHNVFPRNGKSKDQTQVEVVEFSEAWIYTDDNHLAEYQVMAGSREIYHHVYPETQRVYPPMSIARYIDTGSFWGTSYVDLLIPTNTETEYMLAKGFQNIQELDWFGIMLEPTTLGIPVQVTRGEDGIKRLRYEPDLTMPDLRPTNIAPSNTGTIPVEMTKLGLSVMGDMASQPTEMIAGGAPGRVDNANGLSMIIDATNIPLTPTATSLALAVSNCYRSMLGHIQAVWPADTIINVNLLDDMLAGITFDASAGTMKLTENSIPHPDEVRITVASQLPRSKQLEKQELMEMLKMQMITPMEFRVAVRKKNLSLPVGNEQEWQNYRRAVLENIQMFGNGQEPKPIIVSELDIPDVHLSVLLPFMARPEFSLASAAVRGKFMEHYRYHMNQKGTLPEGMSYPEEAAGEDQMMAEQAQQMAEQEAMPQQ